MAGEPLEPPPLVDIRDLPYTFQEWLRKLRNITSGTTPSSIPWSSINFTTSDHNNIAVIQGGTTTERYHLTKAQYNAWSTINTLSSATTIDDNYGYILANAAGAGFTITLPAATVRTRYHIKKTDATGNVVTISRAGADTFETGGTTLTINTQNRSYTIYSDGVSRWYIESST